MNKLLSLTLSAGLIAASTASAKVSFSLAIEALTQSDGVNSISDSGLLVLVVDTGDDGFQLPGDGSLVSGNDEVVTYWDLDDYSFTTADITLTTDGGVDYGANWSEDDSLALFWFPSLSASNMVPGADTVYGVFADAASLASGDAWKMPADGTFIHSLRLFTTAATQLILAGTGEQPAMLGSTVFAVNNPPSTAAPSAPSLAVSSGNGSSLLTWTASGTTAGFIVQRRIAGGAWESIGIVNGTATSYEDSDLQPGRDYEYRLYSLSTFATALSNIPSITSERSVFFNVSARSKMLAGDPQTAMFGGVVVQGADSTKNVVIQAIGRSYYGTDNWLTDPSVSLNRNEFIDGGWVGVSVGSNDNWLAGDRALEIEGAMALGNAITYEIDTHDDNAAMLVDVEKAKGHSFAVGTGGDEDGEVFIGIFDADSAELGINDNRIVNLSARGYLDNQSSSDLFAGSTIIRGSVPKEVLVMAWGPYLSGNVDPSLDGLTVTDPILRIKNFDWQNEANNVVVATNDDWETQTAITTPYVVSTETDAARIERVIREVGYPAFNAGGKDSALLVTLKPGAYTFEIETATDPGITMVVIQEVEID